MLATRRAPDRLFVRLRYGAAAALALAAVVAVGAQPAIDVVSIRENRTARNASGFFAPDAIGWRVEPGRLVILNIPLEHIVAESYGLGSFGILDRLILGWPRTGIKDKRFDITVTFSDGAGLPSAEQRRRVVAAVLASRFGFKAHRETRSVDGYRLMLAKPGTLGPRLRRVEFNCAVLDADEIPRDPAGRSLCGAGQFRTDGSSFLRGSGAITALVNRLNTFANVGEEKKMIVDATGLTGFFVWEFDYGGRHGRALVAAQDQLGLRLEPARVPVSVVVIDDVRMPTPN
jgi:uncharacterized protein (TIGR03435 family)